MTATVALWNSAGNPSSGTYPVNSIFGFPSHFSLTEFT
jgi:hypothetical protein